MVEVIELGRRPKVAIVTDYLGTCFEKRIWIERATYIASMKHLFNSVIVHHSTMALDRLVTIEQLFKAPTRCAEVTTTASIARSFDQKLKKDQSIYAQKTVWFKPEAFEKILSYQINT